MPVALPPRARLERLLTALATRLPEQLGEGLDHPRFAHELPALRRFADPAHVQAALDALSDEEQVELAEALLQTWSALAEVVLPPACAILGPHDHWLAAAQREIVLGVAVDGLDEGWTATWRGAEADGDGHTARVVLAAREEANVQVRVEGRADGERTLLVATARLRGRVPVVHVSGERLVVMDHAERRARGVRVRVGEREYRADGAGLVVVEGGIPDGAEIEVEGVRVPLGREPDGG